VFFLRDETEVTACFKKLAKRAQNEFDVKIKKIRSDNWKEFVNINIEEYCDEVGIKHEVSTTYTPQQNGVERERTGHLSPL
jgi:transposase InsO family protein